jgi:hypothetical protein
MWECSFDRTTDGQDGTYRLDVLNGQYKLTKTDGTFDGSNFNNEVLLESTSSSTTKSYTHTYTALSSTVTLVYTLLIEAA